MADKKQMTKEQMYEALKKKFEEQYKRDLSRIGTRSDSVSEEQYKQIAKEKYDKYIAELDAAKDDETKLQEYIEVVEALPKIPEKNVEGDYTTMLPEEKMYKDREKAMNQAFGIADEPYIDDIPFSTEDIVKDIRSKDQTGQTLEQYSAELPSTSADIPNSIQPTVTLPEVEIIAEAPNKHASQGMGYEDTTDYDAIAKDVAALPSNNDYIAGLSKEGMGTKQSEFTIPTFEEEGYIDDIPFDTSKIMETGDIPEMGTDMASTDITGDISSIGSTVGAVGDMFGSLASLATTIINRSTDSPNKSFFEAYAQDALGTLNESKKYAKQTYDLGQKSNLLAEHTQRERNRNSARGVSSLRGLDMGTHIAGLQANERGIMNYSNQMMNILGRESNMLLDRDRVVMGARERADLRNRADKDAYYTNLSQNFADIGATTQNIGATMNQNQYNNQAISSMNAGSPNVQYIYDPVTGTYTPVNKS